MGTWVKPVRELNGQEQSQVESYRRLNKTPLEICQYRVGVVERLSAAMSVDRSGTKPKWGTV